MIIGLRIITVRIVVFLALIITGSDSRPYRFFCGRSRLPGDLSLVLVSNYFCIGFLLVHNYFFAIYGELRPVEG